MNQPSSYKQNSTYNKWTPFVEQRRDDQGLIRPKRIYNFCLFHAYFGDFAICFDALSYPFIKYLETNLVLVKRVHKFLFLYFMCRNYLYKVKNDKRSLVGVRL